VREKHGARRRLAYVVGFVALAAVPVLALNSLATADTGSGSYSPSELRPPHRELAEAQRQCLAAHGVTLPTRPADGTRPQLTPEQRDAFRQAFRQAAEACGLPIPSHGPRGGDAPV
jgi:hypothetical protein